MHLKGRTECYECRSKPPPKSFPVCTIRNTPDKPIHCVVWAKELLFQRLFGRFLLSHMPLTPRSELPLTMAWWCSRLISAAQEPDQYPLAWHDAPP